MIQTFSQFFYGTTVDRDSRFLNFDEGGGELSLELTPSSYTLTELATAVQSGLNSVGANTYTVTVDRSTRLATIAADASFDLLIASGSQSGQSVFSLLGFTGADLTGGLSYTGNEGAGSVYRPQFMLQSYVPPENFSASFNAVINKTAEGAVEVVTFGRESFIEMDIKFITDKQMDGKVIKNDVNGLANARAFMDDITTKSRFEFMPDIDDPDTFSKVILESTQEYADGTGYKLQELISQNLPDFYETGLLKMRVVT